MSDLLKQYNVNFYKRIANGRKYFDAIGGGLAEFLFDLKDLDSIDDAIATVNYYINGGAPDSENMTISGEMCSAWLLNGTYNIYPDIGDTTKLLQSVPLQDFHDILVLWRGFLTS